jgi:hypothetical protein
LLKNKKVFSVFYVCALTFLLFSVIFTGNLVHVSYQADPEEPIYLHSEDPLVPIHMHGPPLQPIHMHCFDGIIDPYYPWETWWHELYPNYCEEWILTSWEDNGNDYLDTSDQIDMFNLYTEETRWYHVDRVTVTMLLMHELSGELIYVEYKDETWNPPLDPLQPNITKPVCTWWHEVWPAYHGVFGPGNPYHIVDWIDNGNGYLDVCDWIVFEPWPGEYWHVEEYSTDLILNEKIMDPIGIWWHELYPSYSNWHELRGWEEPSEDPYSGRLSPGDQIDMFNETSGITKWYFVDRVTLTLNVTVIGEGDYYYFFEYKGPFEDMYEVKTNPVCTNWTMVWPEYCQYNLHLDYWEDNCNGVLDHCDNVTLGGVPCHVEELCIDIILNEKIDDPTCTYWHELYPECCVNDYHVEAWEDNGDKLLSPCDNVTLALMPTGPTDEYHVDEITITLNLTILDWSGMPPPGDRIYIEFLGGYEWMYYAKIDPLYTDWQVVCPVDWFKYPLTIEYWEDNCNGVLSYCDYLELVGPEVYLWCHIEDVAVDMIVSKFPELVHDVAVTSVVPSFGGVPQDWPCPITVTVENQGDFTETFDVDCKYDGSHVTTSPITVSSLPPGGTTVLTFCWVTKNVPLSTYTISAYAHQVSGETDLADNTFVDDTVTILASSPLGFYWKEGFCDYAPSGMPDFDERQDLWNKTGTWTWCSPTAVANSLWWLDSEFEPSQPPVLPPTISNGFPLVSSYIPGKDDHDPANVQPFIQHLAYLMDTDGQRTSPPGPAHIGTNVLDMEAGLAQYLSWTGVNPLGDVNGDGKVDNTDYNIVLAANGTKPGQAGWNMAADIFPVTLGWPAWGPADNLIDDNDLQLVTNNLGAAGLFYEHTVNQPDFYYIEGEVEKSQDVVLSIGFWYFDGENWAYREELGHTVTVAGVNSEELKIAISDPMLDAFENGLIPEGRVPIPHAHLPPEPPYITHNDAALVSHDIYDVTWINPPLPPCPGGNWTLLNYPGLLGEGWFAIIEDAVITSPLGVHDINITDVTTHKTIVGKGKNCYINVTILNEGTFTETFNVTVYANTTEVDTQKVLNLAPGTQITITLTWNTSGFAYAYTITAYATPDPAETDLADNTFIDGVVKVSCLGDLNGDYIVDGQDYQLVKIAVPSMPGSPNWNPNADLNDDGIVDGQDFQIVKSLIGTSDP